MRALRCIAGLVLIAGCSGVLPAPHIEPATTSAGGYPFPDVAADATRPAAPLSLTASDGTGLTLVELGARALIEDPLAFTELHLVFDNPEDRRLEGTFSITLPEGAALSRFAMKLDDGWQEGEVVEKKAAREAYEDFLHRKQDPALLEQAAGNQFSARVFPIPARGRKELIVSYSQELTAARGWSLPLRGLPQLGRLDVAVTLASQARPVVELTRTNIKPDADFTLDPGLVGRAPGLRSGNLAVARVRPLADAEPDPLGATLVLVDTSASRALGFDDQVKLVDALVRRIATSAGPQTKVAVACFDQELGAIFEGDAGEWGAAEVKRMRARQAFGASDLGRALAWAEARAAARGYRRVIVIGDGVATAGETSTAALAARAAKLGSAGVERLDAVAVGGIRDEATLKKLSTAGLARDGIVADAAIGLDAIAHKLSQRTRSGIAVEVEGARWSWPARLDGVQAGDEALVYADVPEGQPVRVRVGKTMGPTLDLVPVARPLLERSFAKAKITSLLAHDAGSAQPALVREVIALSTRHRVLSPYTSMLVLETEHDFARFDIDRKALADILTVSGNKLAVAQRRPPGGGAQRDDTRVANTTPRLAPPPTSPWARDDSLGSDPLNARGSMWGSEVGDSFGAGGLGLAGVGEGGGGRGEGIGLGAVGTLGHGAGSARGVGFGSGQGRIGPSHQTTPPAIRSGASTVSGRVAPEVIKSGIRPQIARVRRCYEAALAHRPNLAGRIAVRFTIGRNGTVSTVSIDDQVGFDATTISCIAAAFRAMTFPKPESGIVTVTYPMNFSPGDGAAPPPQQANQPPREPPPDPPKPSRVEPYTGRFKSVMDTIGAGGARAAVEMAFAWHHEAPGDVMALVALGEALEAAREPATAARAYGSIIDLFPARADLRRFAGERLERLGDQAALDLAIDTFAHAEEQRPDHPASHRLLALAKLRRGDHEGAFAAALRGVEQPYPRGRFRGVVEILREDLGLIAAAWIKVDPKRRDEIVKKLDLAGARLEDAPSLRFVLGWETDANDVDFHIEDAEGGHAYYRDPELPSGGRLYADVTTGYGPECFTIRLPRDKRSAEYKLAAHYYARGPMGYGMGKLEIIDHDGKGGLSFDERPFVVMADRAFLDLGSVRR